ncbi:uncharacterized protein LOC122266262 [Penaeus japonicus]|uniref:uncharacterized protein LOC122266262 n=1 Tax=Penaeus japonicus TaxID=27405 RepID=UPI001C714F65|nr:uncharacterized protein LOC122266262 [Penaeus japonicus]
MLAKYKMLVLMGVAVGVASVVASSCLECQLNSYPGHDRGASAWPSSLYRDGPVTPVLNKLRRGGFTPNNPFVLRNAPPSRPRLSDNDFLIGDSDDYTEDEPKFPWLPAARSSSLFSGQHHAKALPGLDHLLENKLGPASRQLKSRRLGKQGSDVFSRKAVLSNKRKNKMRKHRQRLGKALDSPFVGTQQVPGLVQMKSPHRMEEDALQREGGEDNDHRARDEEQEDEEHMTVPELFAGPRTFPKDFVSGARFNNKDFITSEHVHPDAMAKNTLQTNHFHSENESDQEGFRHRVLSKTPFVKGFGSNSFFEGAPHEDFDDKLTFPEPFADLGPFGETYKDQEPFSTGEHSFGNLGVYHQPDFLQEGGEGLDWLHNPLSGLNLPSSKDIISDFEHPKMTTEAQREACHARNIHTCGKKVITEFTFEPDFPEKCRIREEFLDCMELQRQQSCDMPEGEHFSREGTKIIRDKIKTLLWSARGCILGYST